MKIINLIMFFWLCILFTSCSSNITIQELITLDNNEYVDVVLYNTTEDILKECKEKITYYLRLFDRDHSYDEIENICSLNEKRKATLSEDLLEGMQYANEILAKYEDASLLAGGLNDVWNNAYLDKSVPSTKNIEVELSKIKNSTLSIDGNMVSILGDAKLDLNFMKRGFILSKIKAFLKNEGVFEYILNFSSRTIIYGRNPKKKYFKCSFYGIKNGYYKIEDMSMSCLGADIIVWYSPEGYRFTNIPSCVSGIPYDGFEKMFVFGNDPLLTDILSYAFFNMRLNDIQDSEQLNNVYTMMYKDLHLVYRNSYLTDLMI